MIAGTAGIGKTALAARWARKAADRFPDGQLWVNLRAKLYPPIAINAILVILAVLLAYGRFVVTPA